MSSGTLSASVAPNPPNPTGTLTFVTSRSGPATVQLFDLSGRTVRTLFQSSDLPAGVHPIAIDGTNRFGKRLPSGMYFYRVRTAEGDAIGRLTIRR